MVLGVGPLCKGPLLRPERVFLFCSTVRSGLRISIERFHSPMNIKVCLMALGGTCTGRWRNCWLALAIKTSITPGIVFFRQQGLLLFSALCESQCIAQCALRLLLRSLQVLSEFDVP